MPKPFPGRQWPTRVAWSFVLQKSQEGLADIVADLAEARQRVDPRPLPEIINDPAIQEVIRKHRRKRFLSYIGKPNRYRAIEAQHFLRRSPGERVLYALEVEFDRGGIIYSRINGEIYHDKVYTAYHPHSGTLGPVDGFSRKAHIKRIGGLPLYSFKERLSQEELEMYYLWFEKSFKKKLRRPKGRALGMKELGPLEDDIA